jgi:hypothetical protein
VILGVCQALNQISVRIHGLTFLDTGSPKIPAFASMVGPAGFEPATKRL